MRRLRGGRGEGAFEQGKQLFLSRSVCDGQIVCHIDLDAKRSRVYNIRASETMVYLI